MTDFVFLVSQYRTHEESEDDVVAETEIVARGIVQARIATSTLVWHEETPGPHRDEESVAYWWAGLPGEYENGDPQCGLQVQFIIEISRIPYVRAANSLDADVQAIRAFALYIEERADNAYWVEGYANDFLESLEGGT